MPGCYVWVVEIRRRGLPSSWVRLDLFFRSMLRAMDARDRIAERFPLCEARCLRVLRFRQPPNGFHDAIDLDDAIDLAIH